MLHLMDFKVLLLNMYGISFFQKLGCYITVRESQRSDTYKIFNAMTFQLTLKPYKRFQHLTKKYNFDSKLVKPCQPLKNRGVQRCLKIQSNIYRSTSKNTFFKNYNPMICNIMYLIILIYRFYNNVKVETTLRTLHTVAGVVFKQDINTVKIVRSSKINFPPHKSSRTVSTYVVRFRTGFRLSIHCISCFIVRACSCVQLGSDFFER